MRQPARPDLWEARVWQPPGPTRQAFGGTVAGTKVPPHARAGLDGRGHRFAAYRAPGKHGGRSVTEPKCVLYKR